MQKQNNGRPAVTPQIPLGIYDVYREFEEKLERLKKMACQIEDGLCFTHGRSVSVEVECPIGGGRMTVEAQKAFEEKLNNQRSNRYN